MKHAERAHSKFAASAAERWLNCPGSVALSEGQPDTSNQYAIEGTKAHEVLEAFFHVDEPGKPGTDAATIIQFASAEMFRHGKKASDFIFNLHRKLPHSELLVETRVYLDFIHPEMFGTFDGAVVDTFGTLHVFDFKYGMSLVRPEKNLQMIFYGIGLAARFQWNFKRVRLWIIQPRIYGYDGPAFWDISISELKSYVQTFADGVRNVEQNPTQYVDGKWCHWCKAKGVCPIKLEEKHDKARLLFQVLPQNKR